MIKQNISETASTLVNPFKSLYEWVEEEELDFEAFIENVQSINSLFDDRQKLILKKESHEKTIFKLSQGKSSIKTLFTFKSKKDDLAVYETEKANV